MTRPAHVVVVGGGVGGLVSAALLAHQGLRVTLLERAAELGGKLRVARVDGQAIDAGPTVFTLRPHFEAVFDACGETLTAHLPLQTLPVLARHAWADGARLDLSADLETSIDAVGRFAGAAAAHGFRAYSQRAKEIHDALETTYMRAPRPMPWTLMARAGWRGLPAMLRISPFARLWSEQQRWLRDPKLQQLFGRYATYCGSSPFKAPATLMLVAHTERLGVWSVDGGMHRVAQALAGIARARGAELRCSAPVAKVLVARGRVRGVKLVGGEKIEADAVIFNGDSAALAQGLLGDDVARAVPGTSPAQRSLSAITWAGVARTRGFELDRHSVFFSDDYEAEFRQLAGGHLPSAPTVYLCAQDRGTGQADAAGWADGERLLALVNAPASADGRGLAPEEIEACEHTTFAHLARCGLQVAWSPRGPQRTTPAEFQARFPGSGGALYGRATHGWMASFQRPGSASRLPGLYLAGGSAHPGPGLPMAATSGWLAAHTVLQRHGSRTSISGWRATAMPGGTSTR
jgi:1-hydroxycarotenoid 3,4-desaturase